MFLQIISCCPSIDWIAQRKSSIKYRNTAINKQIKQTDMKPKRKKTQKNTKKNTKKKSSFVKICMN